ncbi:YheC/YheD family protein [Paenibacillus cremeus]|uniref:YheC/YheD family protein n=1 Tax=Paenibacillus cremeus TaxID=2163881 RepID=A0A559KBI7_9BACL|nr:YheC/YheD family protein [Paenibacillus cremeus]TVY09488.1 YheC/YheD family protein [Paenibacillus cremeus]
MGCDCKRCKRISSKLKKHVVLLRDRQLSDYVPSTLRLTRGSFRSMLNRYGMVYIKPVTGSLGIGVMRVEKKGRTYRYKSGLRTRAFRSFTRMYRSVEPSIRRKRYLVQKGIHVLKYQGRPFDFRVVMQKNPNRQWEWTGTAARVAHPGKVVTNGSQGGTIYPAQRLLRSLAGKRKASTLMHHMTRLGRLTARQFGQAFPAMNELGLDIAIDRRFKPWILEVNTSPDPCPFTKLDDRSMLRRMVRYAKAYGKVYNLTCNKAKKAPGPRK